MWNENILLCIKSKKPTNEIWKATLEVVKQSIEASNYVEKNNFLMGCAELDLLFVITQQKNRVKTIIQDFDFKFHPDGV